MAIAKKSQIKTEDSKTEEVIQQEVKVEVKKSTPDPKAVEAIKLAEAKKADIAEAMEPKEPKPEPVKEPSTKPTLAAMVKSMQKRTQRQIKENGINRFTRQPKHKYPQTN